MRFVIDAPVEDRALRSRLRKKLPHARPLTHLPFVVVEPRVGTLGVLNDAFTTSRTSKLSDHRAAILCGLDWLLAWIHYFGITMEATPSVAFAESYPPPPDAVPVVTRPALMPAINISQGPEDPAEPFAEHDPINVATRVASEKALIVLAAGNDDPRTRSAQSRETVLAWAQAPWVIAVGATEDEDGQVVAEYSAVGRRDVSGSGPDLVAWGGQRDSEKYGVGTSWAAARISKQVCVLAAFCLLLGWEVRRLRGITAEGIPPVGFGLIDEGALTDWPKRVSAGTLVGSGIRSDNLRTALRELDREGIALDLTPTPRRLRALLFASAQHIDGEPHIVGRGFVSPRTVARFLSSFSGRELARFFAPAFPTDLSDKLQSLDLVDPVALESFNALVESTEHVWWWNRSMAVAQCGQWPGVGDAYEWEGIPADDLPESEGSGA